MSQAVGLQGYGFTSDTDDSLKSKTGAKFGGNFGVGFLTKFAYNPNLAKEGEAPREAIEIFVKIGDKDYREWINPVISVRNKDNQEITDKTSPEYINGFNTAMSQLQGVVTHYIKAVGVSEDALKNVLTASPVVSFADYAQRVCSLLPIGYDKKPLDIFLEYQWNFGKKSDGTLNDKTYPTLPKNMKAGYFIIPAQPGVWTESITPEGALEYVNSNGAKHPFAKSADFMKSNKGKQQIFGQAPAASPMGTNAVTPGNGAAQTTGW